ncbi:hypothetical protein [Dickeya zeae]|uniref:hypothetical protein n=1 Tax=Dickeya zeae TaxID=204042 RepID=UPI00037269E6|nr:hypothetical protein [Dickeya zeae]UJR54774.1 hypothetical protein J417_12420 [Dickeya zeae MS1]
MKLLPIKSPYWRRLILDCAFMFIFAFIDSFWPGEILTFLLMFALLIWFTVHVIQLLIAVFRWQWRNIAARIGAFLLSALVLLVCIGEQETIHVALLYPIYLKKIHATSNSQNEPLILESSDYGAGFHAYIYDISGKEVPGLSPHSKFDAMNIYTKHIFGPFFSENAMYCVNVSGKCMAN